MVGFCHASWWPSHLAPSSRSGEGHREGAEGSGVIAVLDTGGVEALAPIDEQRRARLRALREQESDIIVPAAVLAEGVLTGHLGHDYHVGRLLSVVDVADVDEQLGHAAGALRQEAISSGMDPVPSGVDAIVASVANEQAGRDGVQIVTSDGGDFEVLASLAPRAGRLSVVKV